MPHSLESKKAESLTIEVLPFSQNDFPERDSNLQLYGYSPIESGWDLFQLSY
jgi:hypothetical protein